MRLMSRNPHRIAQTVGLAFLLVLPTLAQNVSPPTAPDLKSPLGDIHSAPIPLDENGNPITPKPPTAAEIETYRRENEQRAEQLRAYEKRQADDEARRAADERNNTIKQLLEEQKAHDRLMTVFYVGLAIVVVVIVSRLVKRS